MARIQCCCVGGVGHGYGSDLTLSLGVIGAATGEKKKKKKSGPEPPEPVMISKLTHFKQASQEGKELLARLDLWGLCDFDETTLVPQFNL